LDKNHVRFKELSCFLALSEDRRTSFACPMIADGSPERYASDLRPMNCGEVNAPEPGLLARVNEFFGTSFRWEDFPRR
jgi:hypothetical protein